LFKSSKSQRQALAIGPEGSTEEYLSGYRRVLIFIFSMLFAPIAFFGLYALCEFFIWGYWRDLAQQLGTALSGTNSIKFSYDGAFPSRPWEWFLSPINAFSIYKWAFSGGQHPVGLLGYNWPPWGPHATGMTSPTIWLTSLISVPWMLWAVMKRKIYIILPVIWFIGVGAVPALITGIMDSALAAVISYTWFVMVIPIIFLMRRGKGLDNAFAFSLFWFIGIWATWIPLAIITDRITYSFYYLPTIPVLCLIAGLLIHRVLGFAEKPINRDFRGFTRASVGLLLFMHLVIFCLLIPNSLIISIPTAIMVLAFSMDYLGFSQRTMVTATVAITVGVLSLRFVFYGFLEKWFGTETIIGLYPANIWFWVVGFMSSFAVITLVFISLRKWVLKPTTPKHVPPAV